MELNGTFRNQPSRRRSTVKVPDRGIGEPPETFDEHQIAAWNELLTNAPPGVVKASDRTPMIALATLYAELLQAPYLFNAPKHGALLKLCTHFAMTPSSRENFSVKTEEPPADELREFRA